MTKLLHKSSMDGPAEALHNAMLLLQRIARREVARSSTVLGSQESIALMLIAGSKKVLIGDLPEQLAIHQSTASRLVAYLSKKKWVKVAPDPEDSRARVLGFTEAGRKLLDTLCTDCTDICNRIYANLRSSEVRTFASYFERLADGFNAPDIVAVPGEHCMEAPSRRLTVAMGFIAPEYFGDAGMDIGEYQLLLELAWRGREASISDLNRILPFDPSKLSRAIGSFTEKGWLHYSTDRKDKRASVVALTAKGHSAFARIHTELSNRFYRGCSAFTKREKQAFTELFQKALYGVPKIVEDAVTDCSTPEQFYRARAFLVQALVEADQHHRLPHCLLDEDSVTVTAGESGKIQTLLSVHTKGRPTLEWLVKTRTFDPLAASSALHLAMNRAGVDDLLLTEGSRSSLDWLPAGFSFDKAAGKISRNLVFGKPN